MDRLDVKVFEGDVCIESVELLLGRDGGEGVQDSVTLVVAKLIIRHTVGYVVL